MKPHPRIRKAIKWGGAAVTVVLVVVWGFSIVGRIGYLAPDGRDAHLYDGCVDVCWRAVPMAGARVIRPGWHWDYSPERARCRWGFRYENAAYAAVRVPMWAPLVLIAAPTMWLLWIWRTPRKPVLCPKCRYDRTGLGLSARCPECGSSPAEPAAHA
jgi:hypothetical protein